MYRLTNELPSKILTHGMQGSKISWRGRSRIFGDQTVYAINTINALSNIKHLSAYPILKGSSRPRYGYLYQIEGSLPNLKMLVHDNLEVLKKLYPDTVRFSRNPNELEILGPIEPQYITLNSTIDNLETAIEKVKIQKSGGEKLFNWKLALDVFGIK